MKILEKNAKEYEKKDNLKDKDLIKKDELIKVLKGEKVT